MVTLHVAGQRGLYSAQSRFADAYSALLTPVIERINGLLLKTTSTNGKIPVERLQDVLIQAGILIERAFVGDDMRSAFTPQGQPLSAFARALMLHQTYAVKKVVESHSVVMRRLLRKSPDVLRWLMTSSIRETIDWEDARGLQLSDRIWRAGLATRMRIDALLADAIRNGTPSLTLSQTLEQFLLPTRAALRTDKPYGRDASYDGMRLARTEISHAHAVATKRAAKDNAFVTHLDWALSAQHPKVDICDRIATIDMDGTRIRPAYTVDECPTPVEASHPQCLCVLIPLVDETVHQSVIDQYRAKIAKFEPAPVTPINTSVYIKAIVGAYAYGEFLKWITDI